MGSSDPAGTRTEQILEMLPERALLCSPDGKIRWLNSLARFLLGRPREQIEGRTLDELFVGLVEASTPLVQRLHSLPKGEGLECSLIHGTGTHIRVELASSGAVDEGVIVILRPTPARAALEASARTYELVFEGAPVGIFHFDAQGAVTACNDAFVRILGSPRRVLLGVRIDTLPDQVMKRCMLDALSGVRSHYEGEYKSATSGQVRSVRVDFAPIFDEQGSVIGGVGIAEDVTERKRAEEAWRRSVDSFRALVEKAPDAIAVHRDGRFVLVNPTLVTLLGYGSDAELLALPGADVVLPDDVSAPRGGQAEELDGPVRRREVRLKRADGETVTAEVASILIDFEGGPAILSFARDVTERRALEARLAQADRLASVGTLAAGVAHEINNPLAYVLTNLQIVMKEPHLRPSSRAALADAQDGCERVRRIVRDLGIFSRVDEDRRVPTDVRDAIDSALNLASAEIAARARLVRDTPAVPLVLGDGARLAQVVLNLVLNATQAIPEGRSGEHTITVTTAATGGWVEVRVSDTGVGIRKGVLERIFEPFWTTKPVGVGTGLGLSIVHGIVQAHGGRVEVESEPGAGSTFRVLLPSAPGATCAASEKAATCSQAPARPARILLVDDERRVVEALRAGLQDRHDVVIETSGRAALARLLANEPFDLVVCDLMMPDMGGMTVLDEVRRARPDLIPRFVLMTGGAYTQEVRARFEHPTVRVLEKPFELADLERMLAEHPPSDSGLGASVTPASAPGGGTRT